MTEEILELARLNALHRVERTYPWVLNRHTSILIVDIDNPSQTVKTAREGKTRTWLALQDQLHTQMIKVFPLVSANFSSMSVADAIKTAKMQGAAIIIYPRLLSVTDGLNTVNEINEGIDVHREKELGTDHASLQFVMLDANTGKVIDISQVASRGYLFASNDQQPASLFEEAVQQYLYKISGTMPI